MRYFFASWIASLRQSARQIPGDNCTSPGNWLAGPILPESTLVEIAGIDAFSGKPELQHIHLLWTVKHLARKKDFRQQPHPAKRHTQHHGDDHKYACGDKNLGNGGENRRIGDRLVRLVLRYNRLVVHRAVQSCAIRGRGRLQYHGEERAFALDGRPRLLCGRRDGLLQVSQVLLRQLRRRVIEQQQNCLVSSLTIVRKYRLCIEDCRRWAQFENESSQQSNQFVAFYG